MKLLEKKQAVSQIKLDNEDLIDKSIRLKGYIRRLVNTMNSVKDDYSTDKLARLREFEQFCEDIQIKKGVLLEELAVTQKLLNEKKDILYGMIEKQDELDEKIQLLKEQESKLSLREGFINKVEESIKEKTNAYLSGTS